MESLNQKLPKNLYKQENVVFDPLRKAWVKATPEEIVRQTILKKMVEELGYPAHLIGIEKELRQLPHLFLQPHLPKRRVDILCFYPQENQQIRPLIMIECKATPLTKKVLQQVIGYNAFVNAVFIAAVNQDRVITGRFNFDLDQYEYQPILPKYHELLC